MSLQEQSSLVIPPSTGFLLRRLTRPKVKVTLRPTISLGVRRPSGTRDQFYFLLEIFF
jgi:hypothetical protein